MFAAPNFSERFFDEKKKKKNVRVSPLYNLRFNSDASHEISSANCFRGRVCISSPIRYVHIRSLIRCSEKTRWNANILCKMTYTKYVKIFFTRGDDYAHCIATCIYESPFLLLLGSFWVTERTFVRLSIARCCVRFDKSPSVTERAAKGWRFVFKMDSTFPLFSQEYAQNTGSLKLTSRSYFRSYVK